DRRLGRDELADDDVLLEAEQAVGLAGGRGPGRDPGRLLEGGGREEAAGVHRRLGDAQEHRHRCRGLAALREDRGIELLVLDAVASTRMRTPAGTWYSRSSRSS